MAYEMTTSTKLMTSQKILSQKFQNKPHKNYLPYSILNDSWCHGYSN